MPRSKKKQKKASKASAQPSVPEPTVPKQEQNMDALIGEAESAVDCFNYDEAIQKLKDVLKHNSSHTKALEMLAGIYIEQSEWEEAQNLLKQCIGISPDTGYSKYFSMAQLTEGEESLSFYQKGIQVLEKESDNSENIRPSKEVNRKTLGRSLSDAYCSVSEIFMTDCCFMDNAEGQCFNAIENAIQSDPSNPDAYQCLANFHLVKEQIKESKEAMEKSLSLWLPHHEALRDAAETVPDSKNAENLIPSYDSRIQTSKLLIELEMFDEATNILDGLVEEDDEVIEVWYLLGWMNYIQGDEYKLNAHYYLKKAKEVSTKLGVDNLDYISHIHELLEELKNAFPLEIEEEDEGEDLSDFSSDSEDDNKMET